MKHFLSNEDLVVSVYKDIMFLAMKGKKALKTNNHSSQLLNDKTFVLLFQKPSTRTRISFETGIRQMGGHCIFMTEDSSQMSRGEPIKDTARVLSSMVQGIIIRSQTHQLLEEFARHAQVPIINALSSDYHPCQLLADIMTFIELRGDITKKRVVWCGDGNNVCRSYIQMARIFDFSLYLAVPPSCLPPPEFLNPYKEYISITDDPYNAVKDADLISTDVWVSMGEKDAKQKIQQLQNYQVSKQLLDRAKDEVLFMHCLPAQEGKEICQGILDDPRSAVWQQAENRLHSQKALLEILFR